MSSEISRPVIKVVREYDGNISMTDFFSSLIVEAMLRKESSADTFDSVKKPEYNIDNDSKEAL